MNCAECNEPASILVDGKHLCYTCNSYDLPDLSGIRNKKCDPNSFSSKMNVSTYILDEAIVHHTEMSIPGDSIMQTMFFEIARVKEENTRTALIKLGWTPPEESK